MKKLNLLVIAISLFFTVNTQAQTLSSGVPQAFPYSSQVRDAGGALLANQFISLRISMRTGSPTGPAAYIEKDTTTTSPTGIFSVVVGGGIKLQGRFDSIPWSTGTIYQQVELDATGGNNFVDMGATQLLSLPYALAAGNGVTDVKYDSTGKLLVTSTDGTTTIKSTAASWMTNGNTAVGGGFLGTSDNTDLVFKRNNVEGIRMQASNTVTMPGKLGIGPANVPATALDVNGGLTLRDNTVNVSTSTLVNVGDRSLIFLNSSVPAANAPIIMGPGLARGQIVMLCVIASSSTNGVRFMNNGPTYNTRINEGGTNGSGITYASSTGGTTGVNYYDGNSITFLWNGADWIQIASSYGRF